MFKSVKSAVVAFSIAIAGMAAVPAAAHADRLSFGFQNGNAYIGVQVGPNRGYHRGNRHGWQRGPQCTPQRAVNKARNMGVRNARVIRANRNVIRVAGNQRGHRVNLAFARAPNCPVIR